MICCDTPIIQGALTTYYTITLVQRNEEMGERALCDHVDYDARMYVWYVGAYGTKDIGWC